MCEIGEALLKAMALGWPQRLGLSVIRLWERMADALRAEDQDDGEAQAEGQDGSMTAASHENYATGQTGGSTDSQENYATGGPQPDDASMSGRSEQDFGGAEETGPESSESQGASEMGEEE